MVYSMEPQRPDKDPQVEWLIGQLAHTTVTKETDIEILCLKTAEKYSNTIK
jgi:hypothetical protein